MGNVFQFLQVPRIDPEKKSVEVRIKEYAEIYGQWEKSHHARPMMGVAGENNRVRIGLGRIEIRELGV